MAITCSKSDLEHTHSSLLNEMPPMAVQIPSSHPDYPKILAHLRAMAEAGDELAVRELAKVERAGKEARGGGRYRWTPLPKEGPPGTYEIYVPGWHPASDNQLIRAPDWKIKKLKLKDAKAIAKVLLVRPVKEADRPRRLAVRLDYPDRRGRKDFHNIHKSLDDALVRNHMLIDDDPDWMIDGGTTEDRQAGRKGTLIRLEDVG